MTEQGAHGATKDEIHKVLHAPPGASTYAALMARFTASKSPEVSIANRIYTDGSLAIEPAFGKVAPSESVDFIHDSEGARKNINAWVSDCTRTLIPELIGPRVLDSDSRFGSVNAIPTSRARGRPGVLDARATRDEARRRRDRVEDADDARGARRGPRLARGRARARPPVSHEGRPRDVDDDCPPRRWALARRGRDDVRARRAHAVRLRDVAGRRGRRDDPEDEDERRARARRDARSDGHAHGVHEQRGFHGRHAHRAARRSRR